MRKTKVLTGMAILSALVVILTLLGNMIRIGPFSVTLSLTPIIVGAAVFGPEVGAMLGAVFGIVVLISGVAGWDGGATMLLLSQNAFATILICMLKGILAGWVSGLVYKAAVKRSEKLAVVLAGITAPVVNTGIFIALMLVFFMSVLELWSSGQTLLNYILIVLTGFNFLIELAINMILASAITTIIKYAKTDAQ